MRFTSLIVAVLVAVSFVPWVSAHEVQYNITLNGPNESPPNPSLGVGTGLVTVDVDLMTMRLETTFSGLTGTTTAAHIHCCTVDPGLLTAGVATQTPSFMDFPLGVQAGSYDKTFDMTMASSYNAAFITANGGTPATAFNALISGFDSGRAYLNLHSSDTPGGEIRGFLTLVPEPATGGLLLTALAVIPLVRRSRRTG
jgi:hypothetical protein